MAVAVGGCDYKGLTLGHPIITAMYIDISFRKIIPLIIIGIVLFAGVAGTFALKSERFGTTPFYASIGLAWQQVSGYGLHNVRSWVRGLFGSHRAALSDAAQAQAIPVLEYHRLVTESDDANISISDFTSQMDALQAAGWHTITSADMEAFMRGEKTLPAKSVLLTFDDGTKQSYYAVDPILKSHGFNAVSYIIVKASEDAEADGSTYYLSPQEIRNMLATGRWEIGSHSYDGHHPYPVDASGTEGNFFVDKLWLNDKARQETAAEFSERITGDLSRAKITLEQTYGVSIGTFAFPFGETGTVTAGNYEAGEQRALDIASDVYSFSILQRKPGEFSYNYPDTDTSVIKRIQVQPSWDGADLLRHLNGGIGKTFPYDDSLSEDKGWINTWGNVDIVDGMMRVSAAHDASGASVILDGTGAWDAYEYKLDGNWRDGFVTLMSEVHNGDEYLGCVFSDGGVILQSVSGDMRTRITQVENPAISTGTVTLAMRVRGDIVQCLYNDTVVLYATDVAYATGGIGVQVWSDINGAARIDVDSVQVRDISKLNIAIPAPRAETKRESTGSASTVGSGTASVVDVESASQTSSEQESPQNESANRQPDSLVQSEDFIGSTIRKFLRERGHGKIRKQ